MGYVSLQHYDGFLLIYCLLLVQIAFLLFLWGSVDIVIGGQEGPVEGEQHERAEHGLPHQQDKVPDVIGDVVDIWENKVNKAGRCFTCLN